MPDYLPTDVAVTRSVGYAEAIASNGEPILLCLEFRHASFRDEDGFPTSYGIVNDMRSVTAIDENGTSRTYIALPFQVVFAKQSDNGAPTPAALQVDNVSLELTKLLLMARESDDPVEVVQREYLASDLSAPHVLPVTIYEATNPVVTVETVSLQLTYGNLSNRKYPARTYTRENFPSLSP